MLAYLSRRVVLALLTVGAISVLSFVIIRLPPGDYISSYIASVSMSGGFVSEQEVQVLRREYGLDKPVYVQYLRWLRMVVAIAAVVLTWALALPIGIYSAVRQYSLGDYLATFVGFIGLAVPSFMLALVLMYAGFKYLNANIGGLFSGEFDLAPWSLAKVWDLAKHLPLPTLILALAGTAQLIRIMRANLLDELSKPYVVTARARGLSERRVILKYPVRVALNPFASTIGYLFPYVVSGSIIVSLVLGLPTVGPLLLEALLAQDMFLAGTIVLLLGVMTVVGTFISDLLLMWIDPRIRLESGK